MGYIDQLKRKDLQAIWKIRSCVINHFRKFLIEHGFIELAAPSICNMTDISPSFEFEYYTKHVKLATSSQVYKQLSLCAFNNVFFLQPVFRKEPLEDLDQNHLNEFWQLDIEMIGSMNSVMDLIEILFIETIEYVKNECPLELNTININLPRLTKPFPIIEYMAHELNTEDDLEELSETISVPTWVLNWPKSKKPEWYYKSHTDNNMLAQTMDLFYSQGFYEAVSGGQRETDVKEIIRKMKKNNVDPKTYHKYLEFFEQNVPEHAGCGLGIERFVQWLCNRQDIIETTPFPRKVSISDI